MSDPSLIVLLLLVGYIILVLEIFVPSYGLLTVAGVGFVVYGIVRAYDYSSAAGLTTLLANILGLPVLALVAVKTFHLTPVGRRLAPPNPTARAEEFAPHHEALKHYLGRSGTTLTPLRPVGTCNFDGARVNCVAEVGMIDRGLEVEAVGIRGRELVVRPPP